MNRPRLLRLLAALPLLAVALLAPLPLWLLALPLAGATYLLGWAAVGSCPVDRLLGRGACRLPGPR